MTDAPPSKRRRRRYAWPSPSDSAAAAGEDVANVDELGSDECSSSYSSAERPRDDASEPGKAVVIHSQVCPDVDYFELREKKQVSPATGVSHPRPPPVGQSAVKRRQARLRELRRGVHGTPTQTWTTAAHRDLAKQPVAMVSL